MLVNLYQLSGDVESSNSLDTSLVLLVLTSLHSSTSSCSASWIASIFIFLDIFEKPKLKGFTRRFDIFCPHVSCYSCRFLSVHPQPHICCQINNSSQILHISKSDFERFILSVNSLNSPNLIVHSNWWMKTQICRLIIHMLSPEYLTIWIFGKYWQDGDQPDCIYWDILQQYL